MKKALNITLSMLAMLALAACGSDSEDADDDNATDSTAVEVTTPPSDHDMTMEGDTMDMNSMEGEDMVDGE